MDGAHAIVFSDFTCPYSYVTEAALWKIAPRRGLSIDYRAFELYPVPAPLPAEPERADGAEIRSLADAAGVRLDRPGPPTRTRKAHESTRVARRSGLEVEMREAIFRACWAEARDIGRIDVLVELGERIGLDRTELKVALDIDAFTAVVLGEQAAAARSEIRSVPTLFVAWGDDTQLLVGARPAAELDRLLTRA